MDPDYVADLVRGERLYREEGCVACHGFNGRGGETGGASLVAGQSLDTLIAIIATGRNAMPGFPGYTREELQDIGTFIQQRLTQSNRDDAE